MTDNQDLVFSALMRGRLIFPHFHELKTLRKMAKKGPLTGDEAGRFSNLEKAYAKVKAKDHGFNAAMKSGNLERAAHFAHGALKDLQEIPK